MLKKQPPTRLTSMLYLAASHHHYFEEHVNKLTLLWISMSPENNALSEEKLKLYLDKCQMSQHANHILNLVKHYSEPSTISYLGFIIAALPIFKILKPAKLKKIFKFID